MAKKKSRLSLKKKRNIHPLVLWLSSFFAVLLLTLTLIAYAYKDVSPMQDVAGAATSSAEKRVFPSLSPTQKSCLVATSIVGYNPCGKDMYHGVSVVCGDGKKSTGASSKECRSLTAWMTQVAQACSKHSSCQPTGTPTPKIFPSITPLFHTKPIPSQTTEH